MTSSGRRALGSGGRWPLAVLLLAALAVKAVVLAQLADHPLLQPQGELDTATYVDLARRVSTGGPMAVGEAFFVSPLYVYFLAAVFVLGGTLFTAKLVQIVLGAVAVGLLFSTTRLVFGERPAYVAAVLAIATGLFTFYEVLILQAAIDPFLTAGSLYLVARGLTSGRRRAFLWAGVAVGCLALNRPNALAYGMAAVGLLALPAWRPGAGPGRTVPSAALARAATFAAGLAIVLAPNAWRNYRASGEMVLISSHGGLNFYMGNSPTATGTYQRLPDITPSIVGQVRDSTIVAERAAGRPLSSGEVSDYFFREAIAWIADHPRDALAVTARKTLLMLNQASVPLNYSYAYYSRDESTLLRVLFVGPWLLIPVGLVGLALPGARRLSTGYWIWAAFVPVYAVSVVAFFVSSRYRLPWLMPLCATSGAALVWLVDRARHGAISSALPAVLTMAALAVVCAWPLGIDDRRSAERARKVVWLAERGEDAEAIRLADSVAADHPRPASLRSRLADALAASGRVEAAVDQYRRSLALDDRQPEVDLALGQALVVTRRPGEAIAPLSRALEAGIRPGVAAVWLVRALALSGEQDRAVAVVATLPDAVIGSAFDVAFDLGTIALQIESADQAARALEAAVRLNPSHGDAREQLGIARMMLGQAAEAVTHLEEACRLLPSSASAHLNLAVAYAATGQPAAARRSAETSLRLDPQEPRTRALLERLGAR